MMESSTTSAPFTLLIRSLAGIWKKSITCTKGSKTVFKSASWFSSRCLMHHLNAASNFTSSVAWRSSRPRTILTTCCGREENAPRPRISVALESTYSNIFCTRIFVDLYCMYFSAEARREHTVSVVMQCSMNRMHACFRSSNPK